MRRTSTGFVPAKRAAVLVKGGREGAGNITFERAAEQTVSGFGSARYRTHESRALLRGIGVVPQRFAPLSPWGGRGAFCWGALM